MANIANDCLIIAWHASMFLGHLGWTFGVTGVDGRELFARPAHDDVGSRQKPTQKPTLNDLLNALDDPLNATRTLLMPKFHTRRPVSMPR